MSSESSRSRYDASSLLSSFSFSLPDVLADQAGAAALKNIRATYKAWMPLLAGYSEEQALDLERRLDEELGWIESGAWGEGGGISGVVTCSIAVKSE